MLENIKNILFPKEKSPIYGGIQGIPCWDICAQKTNPNSINSKAFEALQQSIFNNGYLFPVIVTKNPLYKDKSNLTELELLDNMINSNDSKSWNGGEKFSTELMDENVRAFYQYSVIDGQQRSSIIRLGTFYYLNKPSNWQSKKSEDWNNGIDIPTNPGKDMLMYIAWRESFMVPSLVLENKTELDMISTTVLLNQARGAHRFESMKDIIYNLVEEGKVDEKWISKNLFMDEESVRRIIQLKGIKTAYDDVENADLSWNPEDTYSYQQKEKYYLNREARAWILENYPENIKDIDNFEDYIHLADSLGFNSLKQKKHGRNRPAHLAPNGTRLGTGEGRIVNGFIPD